MLSSLPQHNTLTFFLSLVPIKAELNTRVTHLFSCLLHSANTHTNDSDVTATVVTPPAATTDHLIRMTLKRLLHDVQNYQRNPLWAAWLYRQLTVDDHLDGSKPTSNSNVYFSQLPRHCLRMLYSLVYFQLFPTASQCIAGASTHFDPHAPSSLFHANPTYTRSETNHLMTATTLDEETTTAARNPAENKGKRAFLTKAISVVEAEWIASSQAYMQKQFHKVSQIILDHSYSGKNADDEGAAISSSGSRPIHDGADKKQSEIDQAARITEILQQLGMWRKVKSSGQALDHERSHGAVTSQALRFLMLPTLSQKRLLLHAVVLLLLSKYSEKNNMNSRAGAQDNASKAVYAVVEAVCAMATIADEAGAYFWPPNKLGTELLKRLADLGFIFLVKSKAYDNVPMFMITLDLKTIVTSYNDPALPPLRRRVFNARLTSLFPRISTQRNAKRDRDPHSSDVHCSSHDAVCITLIESFEAEKWCARQRDAFSVGERLVRGTTMLRSMAKEASNHRGAYDEMSSPRNQRAQNGKYDVIITETNFRLYLFLKPPEDPARPDVLPHSSQILLRLTDQFAARELLAGNFAVYQLERESFLRAVNERGLSRHDIITFLSARAAHPVVPGQVIGGDVPQSVKDQLALWEVDAYRVVFGNSAMLSSNTAPLPESHKTSQIASQSADSSMVHLKFSNPSDCPSTVRHLMEKGLRTGIVAQSPVALVLHRHIYDTCVQAELLID